jgi:hypothetical protein
MKRLRLIAGCIGVLLQLATAYEVFAANASLDVFWSIPLPRREYPVSELVVHRVAVDEQGFIVALAANGGLHVARVRLFSVVIR